MDDWKNWEEISTENEQSEKIWDFDVDGVLMGTYKNVRGNVGPNASNMYFVDTKEGLVAFWGSEVLNRAFTTIPAGSQIRVEYLGKKKNDNTGRTFKAYNIRFNRPK